MAQAKAANLGLKEMTKQARDAWIRANPGKPARPLGWKRNAEKKGN